MMTAKAVLVPSGLETVRAEIARACRDAGRDPATVALVAVSKTFGAAEIEPVIEAGQRGERRLPLEPGYGMAASRHDLARWLAGGLDVDHCLTLARALMALDVGQARPRLQPAAASDWPDDAWLAIRLALLPWPLPDGRKPGTDPAILRRLQAGDLASALELSLRRLRPAGIRCSVRAASASAETARRYAAALAFPIDPSTAAHFAQRLDPTATTESAP